MSIRFACKCGKHLRAGDTMAGRHTLCPKCGALVAIPALGEATSGAAPARPRPVTTEPPSAVPTADDAEDIGPILVRVRRKNDKDPNRYRKSVWVPLDPERGPPPEKLPKPVRAERRRYHWKLESRWYQSIPYVFRARFLLSALSLMQAALLVWLAVLLPKISAGVQELPLGEIVSLTLLALVLGTYTLGLFDCVLTNAGAGEYRIFVYPGPDIGSRGAAAWLACFCAGPIVPAIIAIVYWLHCGVPDVLDWIIISELVAATCGYWLFGVLAAREAGTWCADPASVGRLVLRVGPRSLLAAVGVPILGYIYLRLLVFGLVRWHINGLIGLPYLAFAQFVLMFGGTFLLRVLGVWTYHSRSDGAEKTPEETETERRPKVENESLANSSRTTATDEV
jgi:hypothetical protein